MYCYLIFMIEKVVEMEKFKFLSRKQIQWHPLQLRTFGMLKTKNKFIYIMHSDTPYRFPDFLQAHRFS